MSKTDNAQGFSPDGALLNLAPRTQEQSVTDRFSQKQQTEDIRVLYQKAQNLFQKKDYKSCIDLVNRIYRADPDHLGALELQGLIALTQLQYETGKIIYTQLTKRDPENPDFQIVLGEVNLNQSNYEEAKSAFSDSLSLTCDQNQKARAYFGLSKALLSLGEVEQAQQKVEQAIEANPDYTDALYFYVNFFTNSKMLPENLTSKIEAGLQASKTREEKILLNFALSKLYRLTSKTDDSFKALKTACDEKRKTLKYDNKKIKQQIDSIVNYFSKNVVLNSGLAGIESERPVFIIAMPRSGTTLLEQILTAHSEIDSIGESTVLGALIESCSFLPEQNNHPYPLRGGPEGHYLTCEAIAHQYNNFLLNQKGPDLKRIINKGMGMRLYIGLLYMMFPKARFLHVKRNPLDCLLSCYSTNFTRNTQPYSYDLKELGEYYLDHTRLIRHWESVIPQKNWINVQYEDLVQNQEEQTRNILSFLGLNWDPACLSSEKSKNPVATASAAQVRKPVHTQAIGKWTGWENHIQPLTEILETELKN